MKWSQKDLSGVQPSMAIHLQTIFVIWPPHSGQAGPQFLQLITCSLASGLCSQGSVCWPHSGPPSYSFRLIAAHPSNPFPGKTSLTLTNTLEWLHFFSPSSTLAWLYQLLNGPHAPDCKPHLTRSHFPLTPGLAYSTLKKKKTTRKVWDKWITDLLFCLL